MTELDPMFIPYMSGKIILSFNPFIPDPLATRNWAVHTLVEVLHFVVAVQCLLSQKRSLPSAARLAAEVTLPLGMFLWPTTELLGRDV